MEVRLDHEQLDVYRVGRELNTAPQELFRRLPRANSGAVDQLRRAGLSVTLNIAEGSGAFAPKEKARFYRIARRSATECAGGLDYLVDCGQLRPGDVAAAMTLVRRIVAMLVRLVESMEKAAEKRP